MTSIAFIDDITQLNPHQPVLLYAHGAGSGGESAFNTAMRCALLAHNVQVVRFHFCYMQTLLREQKRRPPPKLGILIDEFCAAYATLREHTSAPLFMGGKSMGARVASHVALLACVNKTLKGVVAFGFPFHAPRKPAGERVAHLPFFAAPMCIIQGTRDAFGNQEEVASYTLSSATQVQWLETACHDFKPLKRSGLTQQACIDHAAEHARTFIMHHL